MNSDNRSNYEWIRYKSARRGIKYHLFWGEDPMSVCGYADRRRTDRAHVATHGNGVPTCIQCNGYARRKGLINE